MSLLATIVSPINEIVDSLGPNDLPYSIPVHPNLVHLTIGLFSIAIAFDYAGAFYPLEKRVFRFLALPVTRVGFHDVGWYNVLACSIVTFFTVAAGFYEMLLAVPLLSLAVSCFPFPCFFATRVLLVSLSLSQSESL